MFRDRFPLSWLYHRNSDSMAERTFDPMDADLCETKEYDDVPLVRLPPPLKPGADLAELIERRQSCRRFARLPLRLPELSTILKQSYGLGRAKVIDGFERCRRPVPSAGALYPLEVYVIVNSIDGLESGICHYGLIDHSLERLTDTPVHSQTISRLFLDQECVADAAAIIVMTAVFARTMRKYGDRGYRYILLEAGHVGQNLMLSCGTLGLATLALGGFLDGPLADLLKIDVETEMPVYAVAVGRE